MRCALVVTLIGCLVLGACGRVQSKYEWERELLSADRAFDHGEYDNAEHEYKALRPQVEHDSERRYIDFQLIRIKEERGHFDQAIEGYVALWDSRGDDEYGSDALFRAAHILVEQDKTETGFTYLDEVICQAPDSVAATRSLASIVRAHKAHGKQDALAVYLQSRYVVLMRSEIGDNLGYELAKLHVEAERFDQAEELLVKFEQRHFKSGLRDDAWWRLAQLYLDTDRVEEGLRVLKDIADERDASWVVGSYDSHYVDDARFLRGLVLLDRVEDFSGARAEFETFLREFPESILRDEARWNMVQASLAAADGDTASGLCVELRRVEPHSRWTDDCEKVEAALKAGVDPASLRRPGVD